ncbi:hypothetical protein SDC9_182499 [bioreactor metagenome]|uniref:Uncharacterized protein n=1 Tax=bioreactor metagenome TaxID=1076179 RepID=A0A645H7M3_9ZZZZ
MTGCELDVPERDEHHADSHHRHEEEVAHHDGDRRADGEKQKRHGADHGEAHFLAGGLENGLRVLNLPPQEGLLLAVRALIDVRANALGSGGQAPEDTLCEVHGRNAKDKKSAGDHADAGN